MGFLSHYIKAWGQAHAFIDGVEGYNEGTTQAFAPVETMHMVKESEFRDLIAQIRAGNEAAAAELVRLYEPAIRRAARIRLTDSRLRRLFDSMDISQSVFASFFVRAALGQFELSDPSQLLRLLVSMSRKKLADHARKETAERRDYRRARSVGPNDASLFSDGLGDFFENGHSCPPRGGDALAAFSGHGSRFVDDVRSWQTVEPAIDFDAAAALAFALSTMPP